VFCFKQRDYFDKFFRAKVSYKLKTNRRPTTKLAVEQRFRRHRLNNNISLPP